jgi:hypothetical protein
MNNMLYIMRDIRSMIHCLTYIVLVS